MKATADRNWEEEGAGVWGGLEAVARCFHKEGFRVTGKNFEAVVGG